MNTPLVSEEPMISSVIKRDGSTAPFDPEKLNKWAEYAARQGVSESELAQETFKQLEDNCATSDIHDAMIKVCLAKKDRKWSKVAARLEFATIRKGMKYSLGITDKNTFKDIFTKLCVEGHWNYSVLPNYNPIWESWYEDLTSTYLECWQIKQWMDKYALRDGNHIIETPHIGALGIGLAIHGDTPDAYHLAKSIITSKVNLPTPVLNGCRNGDFDSISCCVISGGDTVESIEVAKHIATRMTAKKAGIGIEYRTRSKNEPVKKGRIKHLGKTPIYAAVDKAVKMFTQVSRGGSATVSYRANDPQIEELLLLKSQRTPENVRLDKLDYSFVYNDAFVDAVVHNQVWNLYTYFGQEDLYENFHLPTDQYLELASKYKPAVTLKARDLLKTFLTVRAETGRVYCMNMTRANIHTPFIDTIHLSNLCQEIMLPTHPYTSMPDLYFPGSSTGETAFCSLAAINVSNVASHEYEHIADVCVRTINRLIDLAPMMAQSMMADVRSRRSIGVGITGLAGWIYAQGLDYDSPQTEELVQDLAEQHYYWMLKASQHYSQLNGVAVQGINKDWLPIDTMISKHPVKLDWEPLRGKDRANSVLVAHMPTESSAVFSNATNGLYPVRNRVIEKLSRKGKVQYIAPDGNYKSAWDIPNRVMAGIYGVVQDFSDQGISADYYVTPSKYPEGKVPLSDMVKDWVAHNRLGNKTMYYLNTNDFLGGSLQDSLEESEGDCSSCKL